MSPRAYSTKYESLPNGDQGPNVVDGLRTTSTVLLNNSAFLTASMVLLVRWDSMGDGRCIYTRDNALCAVLKRLVSPRGGPKGKTYINHPGAAVFSAKIPPWKADFATNVGVFSIELSTFTRL